MHELTCAVAVAGFYENIGKNTTNPAEVNEEKKKIKQKLITGITK